MSLPESACQPLSAQFYSCFLQPPPPLPTRLPLSLAPISRTPLLKLLSNSEAVLLKRWIVCGALLGDVLRIRSTLCCLAKSRNSIVCWCVCVFPCCCPCFSLSSSLLSFHRVRLSHFLSLFGVDRYCSSLMCFHPWYSSEFLEREFEDRVESTGKQMNAEAILSLLLSVPDLSLSGSTSSKRVMERMRSRG